MSTDTPQSGETTPGEATLHAPEGHVGPGGAPGVEAVGGIEIRTVGEADLGAWGAAVAVGFMRSGTPEALEYRRLRHVPGRTLGAFDGGRCVATYRSFPTELTVPGGALLPASAITTVTTTQTHRRRGLLTRMMNQDLAASRERGEAVAILVAAEYGIYGRYGFGPATRMHGWEIDLGHAGGLRAGLPQATGGRIELIDMDELGKLGPEFHERWRRTRPGAIARDESSWKLITGAVRPPASEWKEPFAAVHRTAEGTVTGLVRYAIEDTWDHSNPNCRLTVQDFLAIDQPTANTLWQYLFSVDWVRRVLVQNIGPDDPLPLLLQNPRAAIPCEENFDLMWLRVLDVPAAFGARTYASAGRVVLDVSDPGGGGHAAGRWALEADADGTGRAVPTADDADLALSASALGTLYLGAESAARLAAASLVTERRAGAVAALDALLRTPLKAWNPDEF
ncbi:GNAT family N-acetyltransferase [Kitasatospora mediocidica]|uniref:GNAT family N-acetyltransferase n=1 Tax=Kitasatospora mediocidica TaxID=58352 RepID=UPI0009FEDA6F|nr:GNAT family N-acetyltransferase [Kitasatospora mediocidica]